MRGRRGQILVLVLLVVVVSLAVGLSVAARNLTNLRTSTQTEQSQRAFSAAEGGVEDVLSKLAGVAAVAAGTGTLPGCSNVTSGTAKCDLTVGGVGTTVNVVARQNYESTVEIGYVGQVDVNDAATSATSVKIEWAKKTDAVEQVNPASIILTFVRDVGGVISQTRSAIAGGSLLAGSNEVGFSAPSGCASADFERCTQISLPVGSTILRIRPFWNKTTVRVSGVGGSIPVQSYDLTSTAKTDLGITRRVQVTRTYRSALPAVFDYALYAEDPISK